MPIPDDNFEALLSDFAADTVDDGFSDTVLREITSHQSKRTRQKKLSLYAAMFLGGIITGAQLPLIYQTYESLDLSLAVNQMIGIPILACIVALGGVLMMESREFSL